MNTKIAILILSLPFYLNVSACELAQVKQLASQNFDFKNNIDWVEQLNTTIAQSHSEVKRELEYNCATLALRKKFPMLKIPYVSLCKLPTSVNKLEQLGHIINVQLFIKQDDMTGGAFYGGNKPRKLEFELARAMDHGATTIITFGCAGSNHAVATSEHSRRLGLKPICMLKPQTNSTVVRKNLLLHLASAAELHYVPDNNVRKIATFATWLDLINKGEKPYIIPTGGSTPLGAVGFVNAAFELKEQVDAGIMPEPDYIYVPCGSVATTVGLILGCKAAGLKSKIVAVAVEPEEELNQFYHDISKLFKQTNALLQDHTYGTFPMIDLNSCNFEINLNCTGPEYAVFTPEGMEARQLLKQTEGIIIDGTYTAKAFAAILADARSKKCENQIVLFWNTYCGTEFTERVTNLNYKNLPACFHHYFEEEVQELDRPAQL